MVDQLFLECRSQWWQGGGGDTTARGLIESAWFCMEGLGMREFLFTNGGVESTVGEIMV